MASLSQRAAKVAITLALLYPAWMSEARAQDSIEADQPDLSPGEGSEELSFDGRHVEPRYLVTYVSSVTPDGLPVDADLDTPRSATVVSVTNLTRAFCDVSVEWFRGRVATPDCVTNLALAPGLSGNFCSRTLPDFVVTCSSRCEEIFFEGRAIVSTSCHRIGLSSRVYYAAPQNDKDLLAITDSKIVRVNVGNRGD